MLRTTGKCSSQQILIAESDPSQRGALSQTLTDEGFGFDEAATGRSAIGLIGLNQYSLVIADMDLAEISGLQLLHAVRKVRPTMPIMLTAASRASLSEQEAMDVGAAALLYKPFTRQQLMSIIRPIVSTESGPEPDARGSDSFVEIPIADFVCGKVMEIDIHIRLGPEKFVKIAHAGEALPADRIKAYQGRKIESLYVSKADFEKYVALQLKLVSVVSRAESIPREKKVKLLNHATQTIVQQLYMSGVNRRTFEHASTMTEINLSVLCRNDSLFSILESLNSHSDHLFAHALGVSVYSTMLARAMGWKSQPTLYKMSMGGLLHDIGMKEVPREIIDKPIQQLSLEEKKKIERHGSAGLDLLKGVGDIPTEILLMIAQHHECRNGMGYPAGLRDIGIFPPAKLICIVDEFCDMTIKSPGITPRSPSAALEYLFSFRRLYLDGPMLEAFAGIFSFAIPDQKSTRHGKLKRA